MGKKSEQDDYVKGKEKKRQKKATKLFFRRVKKTAKARTIQEQALMNQRRLHHALGIYD